MSGTQRALELHKVRGFNYNGSWGTSGLDLWLRHDSDLMKREIDRGLSYFPAWNAVRWWLSHEAFQRRPDTFLADFEAGLQIFAQRGITVMPVLFNRWHDQVCDFGGVYPDHFMPGASLFLTEEEFALEPTEDPRPYGPRTVFEGYLTALMHRHASDDRIFAWDLCNEPLMGPYGEDPVNPMRVAEVRWLTWVANTLRAQGAQAPLTVGHHMDPRILSATESLVDFISLHPYWIPHAFTQAQFEEMLDDAVAFARGAAKELLATETVWGAVDDVERADILDFTLREIRRRGLGFLVHALHHSLVADLHAAEFGPVGEPGRLEFINADGTLRTGHGRFNDYA